MLHISIWEIETFYGVLSGDGTAILGPLWQRAPPNWGLQSAVDTALPPNVVQITLRSWLGKPQNCLLSCWVVDCWMFLCEITENVQLNFCNAVET